MPFHFSKIVFTPYLFHMKFYIVGLQKKLNVFADVVVLSFSNDFLIPA